MMFGAKHTAPRHRAVSRGVVAGFAALAAWAALADAALAQGQAAPRTPRTIEQLLTRPSRPDVSLPPGAPVTGAAAEPAPALAATLTPNEMPVAVALQAALVAPPADRNAQPVLEATQRFY